MRKRRLKRNLITEKNRWLISYADLMTLLFAFFVVMYASTIAKIDKYKDKVVISVESALYGKKKPGRSNSNKKNKKGINKKISFKKLGSNLKKSVNGLYNLHSYTNWYELDIKSTLLYKTGQVDLKPDAIQNLKSVAKIVKESEGALIVEGYTDNIPIHNARHGSNWMLSAQRAAAVAQVLDSAGLNDRPIAVVGYGSQYPVASNKSVEGREKNRRVIVVIAVNSQISRISNPSKSGLIFHQEAETQVKTVKELKTKSGVKFTQGNEAQSAK